MESYLKNILFEKKILRREKAFTSDNFEQNTRYNQRPKIPAGHQKVAKSDWEFLEDALNNTLFFQKSPIDQLVKRQIIQDMYVVQVSESKYFLQQDQISKRAAYIVKEGQFQVFQKRYYYNTSDKVNYKKRGEIFGEYGLLFNKPPNANVQACVDSQVWVLTNSVLRYHLKQTAEKLRNNCNELLLNCVPRLQDLKGHQKEWLIQHSTQVQFQAENTIIQQGEVGSNFYIIKEGEASVIKVKNNGELQILNKLFSYDYFGDRALLTGDSREAMVKATKTLVCLVFKKEDCLDILQKCMPTREENQINDLYRYAQHTMRITGGSPSGIAADVHLYRNKGPQDTDYQLLVKCTGHMEEVKELVEPYNNQSGGGCEQILELVENEVVGVGAFAKVFIVTERSKQKKYAMKRIEMKKVYTCPYHIFNEQKISKRLQSDFTIRLHASFKDRQYLYMLFDLLEGGDLMDVLTDQIRPWYFQNQLLDKLQKFFFIQKKTSMLKGMAENQARFYTAQIVLGIEYLHNEGIIYRDLKLENVLLDRDGYIKLADFGLSKVLDPVEITQTFCGSPAYVAPENIKGQGYQFPVDWYSLGVLLYYLLTGKQPFVENHQQLPYEIMLNVIDPGFEVAMPTYLSPEAQDLIKKLLESNVQHRLKNANDIKKHEWFQGLNWDQIRRKEYKASVKPRLIDSQRYNRLNLQQASFKDPQQAQNGLQGTVSNANQTILSQLRKGSANYMQTKKVQTGGSTQDISASSNHGNYRTYGTSQLRSQNEQDIYRVFSPF